MNLTSRFCALFLAAAPVVWAQGPTSELRPASPALALRFEKVALGNVIRVISAKFSVPITLTSNATAAVSGDFSNLALGPALEQVARQAGLVVVPLGKTAKEGFSLDLPTPESPVDRGASTGRVVPEENAGLAAAAERRAQLLRKRKELTESQAQTLAKPAEPTAQPSPP